MGRSRVPKPAASSKARIGFFIQDPCVVQPRLG